MLAGIERLDKDLTISQMQGKFQLSIVPDVDIYFMRAIQVKQ